VFDIDGVKVGVNICFDIVDDALLQQTAEEGAQVVFAQSNNADFGTTDESVQQLAIARVRAMEFGRSVVVVSTVATSEIIAPDGSTIDSIAPHTPGAMIDDVPLATALTPATSIAQPFGWVFGLLGIALLLVAAITGHTKRRPRR
jgi:apolipoprotein N-acyltransferase